MLERDDVASAELTAADLFPGGGTQRAWFFWVTAALPSFCFAFSLSGLQLVGWKDPALKTWPSLLVDRPGTLGFLPLAIPVIAVCAMVAARPGPWVQRFGARLALGVGTLLALQYSLLNLAVVALEHQRSWFEGAIEVGVWFFLALVGSEFAWFAWCGLCRRFGGGQVWATFALGSWSLGLAWIRHGNPGATWWEAAVQSPLVFFFAWLFLFLVVGPVWSLLALVRFQSRLEWPVNPKRSLGAVLGLGGYLVSWRLALFQAAEAYEKLPDEPPNCFVATAAGEAPSWLSGGVAARSRRGSSFHVTPQLQRLKLGELALLTSAPGLHRRCRRLYDAWGPRLASHIRSPGRAACAWLMLEPIAWLVAALVVGLAGREARSRRVGIYGIRNRRLGFEGP